MPAASTDALIGGWQLNTNVYIQSGLPFDVGYRGSGDDRDVGPNRPNVIGDTSGPKTKDEWFNATPIGDVGSAFCTSRSRDLRRHGAQLPDRARLLERGRLALQAIPHQAGRATSSSASRS